MNAALRIGLGIVIVVALVLAGLTTGWALWGRRLWAGWGLGPGHGMMGRWGGPAAPCAGSGWGCGGVPGSLYGRSPTSSETLTIEEAYEAVGQYVDALGYPRLEIAEVMEFEDNFYAIVEEADAGIGAMELLVDRWTGEVGPEVGPNMMWNTKYGMHGRGGMVGGASETNALPPEEALEIAQRWLAFDIKPDRHGLRYVAF